MKHLISVFVFLFLVNNAQAQAVPSSCYAHDSIRAKYAGDADRLTVRRAFRQQLSYRDSIIIPQKSSDTILRALIAVYNATSLPARDSVVSVFNIHTFPDPVMDELSVAADSSLSWMKQLKKGNTTTGNAAIDQLITQYHLSIGSYNEFSRLFSWHRVIFVSDSQYNIRPLAKQFEANPGVDFAELMGVAGDGTRITDSIYSDHVELVYSYGWGDCPAGCIKRRYWKFKVYFDCSVQYAGSYGSTIPAAGIQHLSESIVSVFPNPFASALSVNLVEGGEAILSLYDSKGRQVLKERICENVCLGAGHLPVGLYHYQLQDSKGRIYFGKLVKIE